MTDHKCPHCGGIVETRSGLGTGEPVHKCTNCNRPYHQPNWKVHAYGNALRIEIPDVDALYIIKAQDTVMLLHNAKPDADIMQANPLEPVGKIHMSENSRITYVSINGEMRACKTHSIKQLVARTIPVATLHLVNEDTGGIDFRYRNLARDITGG